MVHTVTVKTLYLPLFFGSFLRRFMLVSQSESCFYPCDHEGRETKRVGRAARGAGGLAEEWGASTGRIVRASTVTMGGPGMIQARRRRKKRRRGGTVLRMHFYVKFLQLECIFTC